ncbi:MAG: DivIVA domain-containing protein [Actinomycetota bacterium]
MDPEEVEQREFLVTLRGYSRDEVDAFKSEVAGYLRSLTAELTASAEELKNVKVQLEQARAQPRSEPGAREAEEAEAQTTPHRELAFKQVAQETERILMAAEQVAEQMHARARQEAAEVLTDARRQAQHGFDQVEESKRRAERDLDSIRESRGLIASQMEDIRRRLDETINRLRIPVESPVTPVRPRGFREDRQRALHEADQAQPVAGPQPGAEPDAAQKEPRSDRDRRLRQIAERQAREVAEGPDKERASQQAKPRSSGEPAKPKQPERSEDAADSQNTPAAAPPTSRAPEIPDALKPEQPAEPEQQPASGRDEPKAPQVESSKGALDELLEEFRRSRAKGSDAKAAGSQQETATETATTETATDLAGTADRPGTGEDALDRLEQRTELLSDLPNQAARRLKRLLQEEHNDILDRLRTTKKAKADAEQIVAPIDEQLARFLDGLGNVLGEAFQRGRRPAGGNENGDAADAVERLITRQVVKPLRSEVVGAIQAGLDADDAASSVAERASDVFRVWKGVRTELLGEGMAYAAYHQGLLDQWSGQSGARKVWVISEEDECPGDVCATNAAAGPTDLKAAFPSGHTLPPAHGGCLCTLNKADSSKNH